MFTIDRSAIRANAEVLRAKLGGAALWAVVKADAYGHGAAEVAPAALEGGASALCVANVDEACALRSSLGRARIVVLGPTSDADFRRAREARLELVVAIECIPEGIPVHVKLNTGMGRWGLSELPSETRNVVGVMTQFACAESDPSFTKVQLDTFLAMTTPWRHLTRHAASSAAALTLPPSRLDAVRCGIALYGVSPFGDDPRQFGLRPALRWESEVSGARLLRSGESTGYGRRFIATSPLWIALIPIGYADGFRRDMTGSHVLIAGDRHRVVGAVSMDVIAVETGDQVDIGTPVTLIGDGVSVEEHARVACTVPNEILCGLNTRAPRAMAVVT